VSASDVLTLVAVPRAVTIRDREPSALVMRALAGITDEDLANYHSAMRERAAKIKRVLLDAPARARAARVIK
jgi:hypothetical protein